MTKICVNIDTFVLGVSMREFIDTRDINIMLFEAKFDLATLEYEKDIHSLRYADIQARVETLEACMALSVYGGFKNRD